MTCMRVPVGSTVMGEDIEILVHGLAGRRYYAVMPRTSTWQDLRKLIKLKFGLPKRVQIILIGNKHVLPQERMDALGCDKIHVNLVIRKPECAQCGSTQALKWCGGCYGVLYCCSKCQRLDWQSHQRVCAHTGERRLLWKK